MDDKQNSSRETIQISVGGVKLSNCQDIDPQ